MAEELNDGGRVAYLEARVGELHQTIGDLRAGWRDADQQYARDVYLLLWLHAEAVWHRGRLEVRLEQVRADRQRRIEKGNRLRSALVDAFGFDQDPDEYPGDEEFIRLLAARPQCAVHPDGSGMDLADEGGVPTP